MPGRHFLITLYLWAFAIEFAFALGIFWIVRRSLL